MRKAIYVVLTVLSVVLTVMAVRYTYDMRGYFAIGGEYILITLPLLVATIECISRDLAQYIEDERRMR